MARWLAWLLVIASACSVGEVAAQVKVKGYFRKDGTYVAPHYRSSPNSSRADNYSSQGNYNPYTGKKGTQDPYRPIVPQVRYAIPAPTYSVQQYAPPPVQNYQPQQIRTVDVWKCMAANGSVTYLAYPRAGCQQLAAAAPSVPAQAPVYYSPPPRQFRGYRCTSDCSGHEAGWAWAEQQGIDNPDDCGGRSQSFIEGCEAYAVERQSEMVENGDCEDEDGDEQCD